MRSGHFHINKSPLTPESERTMSSMEAYCFVRETLGHVWISKPKWYRMIRVYANELGVQRAFAPMRMPNQRSRGGNFIFTSRKKLENFQWMTAYNKGK